VSEQVGYVASARYVGASGPFAERFFPDKAAADRYALAWQQEAERLGYRAVGEVRAALGQSNPEGRPLADLEWPVGDRTGMGGRPKA
jgi:hypothetical protein